MTKTSPYVGPRALREGDLLFGRDTEIEELLDLMLSERIVLLYSPSGAGKSSLVEAALRPALEQENFHVLPTMRVSLYPTESVTLPESTNQYLLSLQLSLDVGLNPTHPTGLPDLLDQTFGEHLAGVEQTLGGDGPTHNVLVFDQFEEILTTGYRDEETQRARKQFFDELGEVLREKHRWAIFVMHEESVAALEPYLNAIPTQLMNSFRLDLLTKERAAEAIEKLAQSEGIEFEPKALDRLVNNLSRVTKHTPAGPVDHDGVFVEPVQLQIVCRRLWFALVQSGALENALIEVDEVTVVVDEVDDALSDYYDQHVAEAAAKGHITERAVRNWFDRRLVTDNRLRSQVQDGPDAGGSGDTSAALHVLRDAVLIRADVRHGVTWFELAHDRLIRPVLSSNARWRQRFRRRKQRLMWRVIAAIGIALVTAAVAREWVHQQRVDALESFHPHRLVLEAEHQHELHRDATGALLAREAFLERERQFRAGASASQLVGYPAIYRALRDATHRPHFTHVVSEYGRIERAVAYSADGTWLASGGSDRLVTIRAGNRPYAGVVATLKHPDTVRRIAFSPDGHWLASASADHKIRMWAIGRDLLTDGNDPTPMVLSPEHSDVIRDLAFRPVLDRPLRLSSASADGTIRSWTLESSGWSPDTTVNGNGGEVRALAYSPDGEWLASGGVDGRVVIRLVDRAGEPEALLEHHDQTAEGIRALAFSPSGAWLATSGPVRDRETDPTSTRVPFAGSDWGVVVWSAGAKFSPEPRWIFRDVPVVRSLAFSSDETFLYGATSVGEVWAWSLERPSNPPLKMEGHAGLVFQLAVSPLSGEIASAGQDRTVRLWQPPTSRRRAGSDPVSRARAGAAVSSLRLLTEVEPSDALVTAGLDSDDSLRLFRFLSDRGELRAAPSSMTMQTLSLERTDRTDWLASADDGRLVAAVGPTLTARAWRRAEVVDPAAVITHRSRAVVLEPRGRANAAPLYRPLASGKSMGEPITSEESLFDAEMSVDGRWLAAVTGSSATEEAVGQARRGRVRLWNTGGVRELSWRDLVYTDSRGNRGTSGREGFSSVAFSGFGPWLGAGSLDATVRLWRLEPTTEVNAEPMVLDSPEGPVSAIAFRPDRFEIASGHVNGKILLWELGRAPSPVEVADHGRQVEALTFTPGGRFLISGDGDGELRVWALGHALAARVCSVVKRNLTGAEWERFFAGEAYRCTCPKLGPGPGLPPDTVCNDEADPS